MATKRGLLMLLVVFGMMFAARTAKAGCWAYADGDEGECSGANHCNGFYIVTYCVDGCTSGQCDPAGNTRECCGNRIDYAAIEGDGGRCDCDSIIRVHARAPRTTSQHSAELLQGYTPGLIMLSASVSYKPAQIFYTFNRCSHSYRVVVEEGRTVTAGKM